MKKILFLVNPVSGHMAGRKIKERISSELHKELAPALYDIEFTTEDIAGQLTDACTGYGTVAVAGGDGTISQVVQAFAGLANKPRLGLIPIGTGNDLARSLGILQIYKSRGLRGILKVIINAKTRPVDIIGIDNRAFFTNYFGIGIDAKISNDFNRLRSRPLFRNICSCALGKSFYGGLGFANIFYRMPSDIQMRYAGNDCADILLRVPAGACQVLVTNITTYAGGAKLFSKTKMDDKRFEVTVISSRKQWLIMHGTRFLRKPLNILFPKLVQFQTNRLEITLRGKSFCQVDGEIRNDFSGTEKRLMLSVKTSLEMIVP
jgi:YegS/Rv2252/BmrU family lipid kinase